MPAVTDTDALILGAGLQGAGVALELARRGIASTLVDQDHQALNRASLRNEGKIHFGHIYANDPTRRTPALQQDGALTFRRIMDGWLSGGRPWMSLSTPFHYVVAHDSVLDADVLSAHYDWLSDRARDRFAADPTADYLSTRPDRLARRLPEAAWRRQFDPAKCAAVFETAELAIDCDVMAIAVREALAAQNAVTFRPGHRVRSIERLGDRFVVEGDGPAGPWRIEARQVVNAMWDQRCLFDQQLGIAPPPELLHRLKYRVIARVPEAYRRLPSMTIVIGAYGDVVVRPNGTAYLSWYPAGCQGWTHELAPPLSWDAPSRGSPDPEKAAEMSRVFPAELARWCPAVAAFEPLYVDAGAIVALGRTDVGDAASGLHHRSQVGVQSFDGYHSVDTGKLTTAPLFAVEAAQAVATRLESVAA